MSSLSTEFLHKLDELGAVLNQPHSVQVRSAGATLSCQVLSTDALSCAFSELQLEVSPERAARRTNLKRWAEELCRRVTYLLEPLQVIEVNGGDGGAVLVRSGPPDRSDAATTYYELRLQTPGRMSLRRMQYDCREGQRTSIPCQMTKEALGKLIDDLAASVLRRDD